MECHCNCIHNQTLSLTGDCLYSSYSKCSVQKIYNFVFVFRLIAVENDLLKNVLTKLKYTETEEKVWILVMETTNQRWPTISFLFKFYTGLINNFTHLINDIS